MDIPQKICVWLYCTGLCFCFVRILLYILLLFICDRWEAKEAISVAGLQAGTLYLIDFCRY